jgi:hypothetical protein
VILSLIPEWEHEWGADTRLKEVKMKDKQNPRWEDIEDEIYAAFKDVKLENGIGYFEAIAMDDYLHPADNKYEDAKAKDEREDWTRLLSHAETDYSEPTCYCFMDAKGLRFFLPFLMICKDQRMNSLLYFYVSSEMKREGYQTTPFTETVSLLTPAQKRCIWLFYDYMSQSGEWDFSPEHLNSIFETGEAGLEGFDFLAFVKNRFEPEC